MERIEGTLFPFRLWMEGDQNYKSSTIDLYALVVGQLAIDCGNLPVDQITTEILNHYFNHLQTKPMERGKSGDTVKPPHQTKKLGVSGWTLTGYKKAIQVYFDWASEKFALKKRPDRGIKLKHGNAREFSPFTHNEIANIFKTINSQKLANTNTDRRQAYLVSRPTKQRDQLLVMLMIDTGISAEEVCKLTESCFSFKDRTIEVKTEKIHQGVSKVKTRTLFLSDKVAWEISNFIESRVKGKVPNPPIFMGKGDYDWTADAIRNLFSEISIHAGVGEINYKRLRATFAVNFLIKGRDPIELKLWLGLDSVASVKKYQKMVAAFHKANLASATRTNEFLDAALEQADSSNAIKPDGKAKKAGKPPRKCYR